MIAATGLTKRYGPLVAVDNIDLAVHRGDIYGFLGANGSGKTTTLRMLLGLVLPTSGSIQLLNESMPKASHRVLPRVGALVEGPSAYGHLSAFTHLSFLDAMGPGGSRGNRRQRIVEVLGQVGLAGVGNRPIKAYSLGMHQRLGLAAALLRHPELLILDEPTNGLDPQGIHEIRDLLLTLNRAGTTVFLSSHLLAEVEQLCTRVGVLDRGRIVLEEEMHILCAPSGRTVVHTPDVKQARALLAERAERHDQGTVTVGIGDPAALNAELVQAGIRVRELAPERRSLEEIVLAATGPSADRFDA
ncbi:MAG: ABC transporter ATP-binding protein [Nocardioidaceae bacterium]